MFAYDFMIHAFLAAGIVAVVSGCVGYFLVLRGQTFAGHALAHIGFTGATGAVLVGAPPLAGLVLVTVAGGVGIGMLGERLQGRDVAIGLVLSGALGLGLLFLHFFTAYASQATALLFGNVLAVDVDTLWAMLGLGALCLAGLGVIARPLLFASLQPDLAEAKGVSIRLMSVLFLAIASMSAW
jgi:zinc/manganese transport system permease protein